MNEISLVTDDYLPAAKIVAAHDMGACEQWAFAGGTAVLFTTRCPNKESANEDAAMLAPCGGRAGIVAVADGLGGVRAGGDAARLALDSLVESIKAGLADSSLLRTAILNGFESANQAVQSLGIGTATTLVVVEIQEEEVRTYHVGDSMVLVVGQRGKVKLQTTSHSPVGFGIEAGLLDEQEAMHHEDRHLVSNVIGSPEMKIEIGPVVRLAARDTLLLASDGLFDNLHIDEIAELIRKGPLTSAIEHLVGEAAQRMNNHQPGQPSKPDDLTVLAFRRGNGEPKG